MATVTVEIDLAAKIVTIEFTQPAPISGIEKEEVNFGGQTTGLGSHVQMGSINRRSGVIRADIVSDVLGLFVFEGTYKPAQKLF